MTRIERIEQMEQYLDETADAVSKMHDALDRYLAAQDHIRTLADYYDSGIWRRDYEADEAGKLPAGLKRGVLSQDALYNLLCDNRDLLDRLSVLNLNDKFQNTRLVRRDRL